MGDRSPLPAEALLGGVVPAAGRRRAGAVALDVVVVLLVLAVGTGVARLAGAGPGTALAMGGVLAAAAAVALVTALVRRGRGVGHRALRLRTVDRRTALPADAVALLTGHGLTADLARGRDPMRIVPAPSTPLPGATDPWLAASDEGRPAGVVLVGDDGFTLAVLAPTLIGRNPVDRTGAHQLAGVPDLSRTISRNHALLEPEGSTLWVTDLGSANGTAVAVPGETFTVLAAQARTAGPVGARLALGDRVLRLTDPRREAVPR